jgi:deoxyribose-phosphate aldolase
MKIASYIDHTLLKQDAGEDDIRKLSLEAIDNSFASVCVNPCRVPLVSELLSGSNVKVCSVTAFPLGATSTACKIFETEWCLKNGAEEIDTVINIGECKSGNWKYVRDELKLIADLVHSYNSILKVILETALLNKNEIVKACKVSMEAGVDFVKTSTGFAGGGATKEDVKLMVDTVSGICKVKASGGIRNYDDAVAMITIGAERIGTSCGVAIIAGEETAGG